MERSIEGARDEPMGEIGSTGSVRPQSAAWSFFRQEIALPLQRLRSLRAGPEGAMKTRRVMFLRRVPVLAVVFLGALVAAPVLEGQNRFERELRAALDDALQGVQVDDDARSKLAELVRAGAAQLAADGASEDQLKQARGNARVLAREIAASSPQGRGVGRSHVDGALRRVCPLYPFCRR